MTRPADRPFDAGDIGTFAKAMGIAFTFEGEGRVEGCMPIDDWKLQPAGFLHGGATITLLESLASRASDLMTDHDTQYSFGVDVHVRHRKPGERGMPYGCADLDRMEGSKQYWNVVAKDELGDIVSSGVIMTKIVPKERLEEKQRERERQRAACTADDARTSCSAAAADADAGRAAAAATARTAGDRG